MDLGKTVDDLKALVGRIHDAHGVGGNPLTCIECVIAALNEEEANYSASIKKRIVEGDFGS